MEWNDIACRRQPVGQRGARWQSGKAGWMEFVLFPSRGGDLVDKLGLEMVAFGFQFKKQRTHGRDQAARLGTQEDASSPNHGKPVDLGGDSTTLPLIDEDRCGMFADGERDGGCFARVQHSGEPDVWHGWVGSHLNPRVICKETGDRLVRGGGHFPTNGIGDCDHGEQLAQDFQVPEKAESNQGASVGDEHASA